MYSGREAFILYFRVSIYECQKEEKDTPASLGVYTPEGGQTQRIRLSPDIRIELTIQGIK